MLLSFLLVASLVLTSCAKEEVVEEEEEEEVVEEEEEEEVVEEEEEEPAVGVPQYGGEVIHYLWGGEPPGADHVVNGWPSIMYTMPVIEHLLRPDFEKYGVRGTGEFPFRFMDDCHPPYKYMRGCIAESWEITPDRDKLILPIRSGILWAAYGKEHVMEPSELTAEDVAWSLNRAIDGPMMGGWMRTENGGWIDSIYAEDGTVVFETSTFVPRLTAAQMRDIFCGWATGIYAPEVVEAGASDWDNLVGTGPFMFKDYVAGSYISYARNPNYHHKTLVNGLEYEIPFIDELLYPIIPDESTQVAAVRTGKLDIHFTISPEYRDTLAQTCPELIQQTYTFSRIQCMPLRCDRPPFDNPEVRRAMMIALNLPAISIARWDIWDIWGWPLHSSCPAYTPFDELPARCQELYDYDPVKAKQILADAGYPGGLTGVELIVDTSLPDYADIAQMAVAYWADIGVDVAIKVMEMGAYATALEAGEYDMSLSQRPGTDDASQILGGYFVPDNYAFYDNPEFTALYEEATAIWDEAKQDLIFKELAVTALESVAYIPLHTEGIGFMAYWPWLRNYYAEDTQIWGSVYAMATLWIDQDLKAEMGY